MRLVIAAVLLALNPAGVAYASEPAVADDCAELVVDNTGLVDVATVRRAAIEVQAHAADVRVRVYQRVPSGDLDAQERADRAACPTWQKPNGQRRANLIILSVSVSDRRIGLYYGQAWSRDLRRRWTAIQSQSMAPSFKLERWTEGLVNGLRATARAIDPMSNPSGNGDQEPPTFVDDPDPMRSNGPDALFGVFAILALIIGGLSLLARGGRGGGGGRGTGGGGRLFRGGGAAAGGFFAGSSWGRSGSSHSHGGGGGRGGGAGGGRGGGGGGGSSSF